MRVLLQLRSCLFARDRLLSSKFTNNFVTKQLNNVSKSNNRHYCEKIERPTGMNKDKSTKIDLKKKAVGPISWFNLGVSGVLVGVMMGFYYYAKYDL